MVGANSLFLKIAVAPTAEQSRHSSNSYASLATNISLQKVDLQTRQNDNDNRTLRVYEVATRCATQIKRPSFQESVYQLPPRRPKEGVGERHSLTKNSPKKFLTQTSYLLFFF